MIWLVLLIPLAAVGFWLWMFWDMTSNRALPPCFISLTGGHDPARDWTFAFVLLNIFTAGYYYLNVYRETR